MWGKLGKLLLDRAVGSMSGGGGEEAAPVEEAPVPMRTNRGINLDELISDSFARSEQHKQQPNNLTNPPDMLDRQLFNKLPDFE